MWLRSYERPGTKRFDGVTGALQVEPAGLGYAKYLQFEINEDPNEWLDYRICFSCLKTSL